MHGWRLGIVSTSSGLSSRDRFVRSYGSCGNSIPHERSEGDDVVTVIFTSGSTGTPKGVILTYANVASQVEAIDQLVHLKDDDVLIGILPLFHSFGYTITMWTVATLGLAGAYHGDPRAARAVGKLCEEQGGTLLLATPTFLRLYLRGCEKEQFKTLEVIVTGAEKLPQDFADAFEKKFDVRPVEGYGATETSPLAAVNVPPAAWSASPVATPGKEPSVAPSPA